MKAFTVSVRDGDIKREVNYGLKESMAALLFQPALKLNSVSLLRQDELAKKIIDSGDELLLEEEEYLRLKVAVDTVQGLGQNDVELVRRIINAPEIEVTAKNKQD